MKIIRHRVNQIAEMAKLPAGMGAEVDLRSYNNEIILNHDVFRSGDSFEEYVSEWANGTTRGTLILNPKEDGLEEQVLETLNRHKVSDFFFLDLTIPTTVRLAYKNSIKDIAIRVSEFETVENALLFHTKVDWIWLDSFTGHPSPMETVTTLKKHFKICLVSPELQGYEITKISDFKKEISYVDAVCTKYPEQWHVG